MSDFDCGLNLYPVPPHQKCCPLFQRSPLRTGKKIVYKNLRGKFSTTRLPSCSSGPSSSSEFTSCAFANSIAHKESGCKPPAAKPYTSGSTIGGIHCTRRGIFPASCPTRKQTSVGSASLQDFFFSFRKSALLFLRKFKGKAYYCTRLKASCRLKAPCLLAKSPNPRNELGG